jgi:hypothetical protein
MDSGRTTQFLWTNTSQSRAKNGVRQKLNGAQAGVIWIKRLIHALPPNASQKQS